MSRGPMMLPDRELHVTTTDERLVIQTDGISRIELVRSGDRENGLVRLAVQELGSDGKTVKRLADVTLWPIEWRVVRDWLADKPWGDD